MTCAFEILLSVAALGGKLSPAREGTIKMLLPPNRPQELRDAIVAHKPALLELLQCRFLIVRSETPNCQVVFCDTEDTKSRLVGFGADPGLIYTLAELGELATKRITGNDLNLIAEAKARFAGRITAL